MAGYNLPSRRIVSQENAALIERANIPRSSFQGSWTRKTAFDAGYLIPILVEEVLPGDHLKYDITAYVRMATPLFPLMDNQRIDTFFFFVPNRLLWEKWTALMGEEDDAGQTNFTMPQVTVPASLGDPLKVGNIYDHMGLPPAATAYTVNALPFRAYNLIWNEWFRDQNLQAKRKAWKWNGPDQAADYELLRRNKAHDYFTSALPWPQKFTPPSFGLGGGLAPVEGIGINNTLSSTTVLPPTVNETGAFNVQYPAGNFRYGATANMLLVKANGSGAGAAPQIYADMGAASQITVNALRQAFMVQALLERDARGGSRYTELLKSHFGVTNPDFRLQRPEYIGGGQTPLQITPVAQTAPTTGAAAGVVGQLGAAGAAAGSHRASFAATEHGYVIGLINVRTDISYQQGLHKMWTRKTRFDFYWPALAALGEQAVMASELYFTNDPLWDDNVFGFQERYHEYRTRYSEVTGQMRSQAPGTLDNWHLAQRFLTQPTLGGGFLEENPPMARVLAAGDLAQNQQYLADILYRRTAVRAMPTFGTPATLGRF